MATGVQKSVYEPDQKDLIFPEWPSFESVSEERQHRKERLALSCRVLSKLGYDYGFAGHLTVRDPANLDLFWTNPFAVPFSHVRVSNLILVDHDGRVVEGDYAVNRAGFVLHSAIHEANPDVLASVHAHTTNGMAWAAMGRPLDPITQTACGFYGDQAVITEEAGAVVVEKSAGEKVAEAFGSAKIAIHQNHGLFSAGRQSVDEATWWFIAADRACEIQMKAESTGREIHAIDEKAAIHSRDHLATPYMAWLHFQPIYQEAVNREPDALL
ncbi:class II aldolase/adducin family protein [Nesterenkonia muleiensis]|uniref:class II aldolase/adducin family protein n=1 Tax=Nesterenkonia muleiensis TaxID=2282648 RepID=UPI000E717E97|nr:class II aldolase/adducin family protein [Nesterenkonia muleiensis]